jgi:hypothetical protein
MMEAVSTSETSVNFDQITQFNIPEDGYLVSGAYRFPALQDCLPQRPNVLGPTSLLSVRYQVLSSAVERPIREDKHPHDTGRPSAAVDVCNYTSAWHN